MIEVTCIKLDNHNFDVPNGLSELLASTWVIKQKQFVVQKEYDRQVIRNNGQIVTILKKKKQY